MLFTPPKLSYASSLLVSYLAKPFSIETFVVVVIQKAQLFGQLVAKFDDLNKAMLQHKGSDRIKSVKGGLAHAFVVGRPH